MPADRPEEGLEPEAPAPQAAERQPQEDREPRHRPQGDRLPRAHPVDLLRFVRIRPSRSRTLGLDASKRQGTAPRTPARLRFAHGSPGRARTQALPPARARGPLGDGQALRRDDLLHPAGGGTGPAGASRRVARGERAHGHGDAATAGPRRLRRDRYRPERHPHAEGRGPGRQDRPRAPAARTVADRRPGARLGGRRRGGPASGLRGLGAGGGPARRDARVPRHLPARQRRPGPRTPCRELVALSDLQPGCRHACAASRRSPSTTPPTCPSSTRTGW